MVFKVDLVDGKGTLKEESERQLGILGLDQRCDGLVTKLEDLVDLLAPLVILRDNTIYNTFFFLREVNERPTCLMHLLLHSEMRHNTCKGSKLLTMFSDNAVSLMYQSGKLTWKILLYSLSLINVSVIS